MKGYEAGMDVQEIAVNDEFEGTRSKNANHGVRQTEKCQEEDAPIISTSHLVDRKDNTHFHLRRQYRKVVTQVELWANFEH